MTVDSRPLVFTAHARDLRLRADVAYAAGTHDVDRLLSGSRFPLTPLGEIARRVQYGLSLPAHTDPDGFPILRMNNLQDDGWDLSDLKYVHLSGPDLANYRLRKGDILINRTNGSRELVGKCEVFREEGDWVFASYLIRLQVDEAVANPEFVAAFLNSRAGRAQITRASRQILQSNINAQEIRSLLIPIPSLEEQETLVSGIDAARATRATLRKRAATAFARIEPTLQSALGISVTPPKVSTYWTASLAQLKETGRLDPGAVHPERIAALQALHRSGIPVRRVTDVATAVRTVVANPPATLGMADVQSGTGILLNSPSQQVSSGVQYKEGDVLFGRLRPRLNKVYLAPSDGHCSPEFIVFRPQEEEVMSEYLAHVLRFSTTVLQGIHLATGNTLPRLTTDDASNLLVPVPPLQDQQRIVDLANRLADDAFADRRAGDEAWSDAKAQLLARLFVSAEAA